MQLRQYQKDIIEKTRVLMREGKKSILIQAPTGAGKTALTVDMLKSAAEKGKRSWFVNHRRELIKQSSAAFAKDTVHHGIVAANFQPDPRHMVQVCSIQTLVNRVKKIKGPDFIVWDECHHVAAGSWEKIFNMFPDAFHVGLSATPKRLDGRGFKKYFKSMVHGPSVAWLIENNFLSSYKLYAPGGIDTSKLHIKYGEFKQDELVSVVSRPSITGNAIHEYKRKCFDRRALGFAVSVEHSKYVVAQFNSVGIKAAHVDGETDSNLRDEILERFRAGEILVVFNCQLFGEGLDLPVVEGLIDLAPTMSLTATMQRWGRVLRIFPGKENAMILDHAQNCMRHGLPDDEREWSLEDGDDTKKKSEVVGVKICPKCLGAQAAYKSNCSYCGFLFVPKPREVELLEGTLEEVDIILLRKKRLMEQGRVQSLDDLIALGKSRNYKRPELWARHVYRARKKRAA